MAEIKPIRAWRYNTNLADQMDKLVSPLFDVVSEEQRNHLYQEPLNSIHLSVPRGNNQSSIASRKLIEWKNEGIIIQDPLPSIYVHYQYFTLPGATREFCRKGFIANIKIYEWDEKVILRHENTIPHSVSDRIEVLDKTLLNVSPTHGLYSDAEFKIEPFLDKSIQSPIYETEDYQGVRDVFGIIQDAEIIQMIIDQMRGQQIILADGHHRYEGSLLYKKKKEKENIHHTGKEGYNYHMMYFTNTESDDLRILPTHRLISHLSNSNATDLINNLCKYFTIKEIDDPYSLNEIILGKPYTFGLLIKKQSYLLKLKEGLIHKISWKFPDSIKKLDLTVLHYYIIEKCIGISGKNQRGSKSIKFERNFAKCVEFVKHDEIQCAIITKEISIDTVKEVCYSGYTLPQKSTYFYPKIICGFLFSSIKEDEVTSSFDHAFEY